MADTLRPDIEQRLAQDFAGDELSAARQLLIELQASSERATDRVVRCVVHLAAGDTDMLLHYAHNAQMDSRDVIYWAEYDANDAQIRDFNQPFPEKS